MTLLIDEMDEIIKKVEEKAIHLNFYGLRGGLIGVVIFYLYCYRVTKNKQYEHKAFDLLKQILSVIYNKINIYPIIKVEICNSLFFLTENRFVAIDFYDLYERTDEIVLRILKLPNIAAFSCETGIVGFCRYTLSRPIKTESIRLAINQLIKGFNKAICKIDPVFLFPSEVLQDVKLFLSEVGGIEEVSEQIAELHQLIENFEQNNSILQSNCPNYTIIQQLREAGINNDKKKIKYLLTLLSKESPDVVIRGLARMSLDKPSLPPWWKLF